MYIEPNSTVKLLSGVPLDNSYRNTVVWDSASAQYNGFNAYTKYTLTNQSYQRVNQGIFRCDKPADSCYDCNYMMFQNTAYSNKWFYAFITSVEYVNNNMCKITFEIDIVQTWYNEWNFRSCFVERETTATDGMFEHLVNENFNLSDYVVTSYKPNVCSLNTGMSGSVAIVLTTERKVDGVWKQSTAYECGKVVSSLYFFGFDLANGLTALNSFIEQYEEDGKSNAILSVYSVPRYVLKDFTWTENGGLIYNTSTKGYSKIDIGINNIYPTQLDGYVPKNKKLFSSPFCVVEVSNNNGSSQLYNTQDLTYENNNVKFTACCTMMPNGEIWLYPNNYKGIMNDVNMSVSIGNYPQGIITYDYFQNWWASEKIGFTTRTVNNIVNGASRILTTPFNSLKPINAVPMLDGSISDSATGSVTSAVRSMGNAVIGTMNDIVQDTVSETGNIAQADIVPPQVIGSTSGFNMLLAVGRFDFPVLLRTLSKDVARHIDDYFSVYGYRVDTLKVPSVRNRPHWTYIKTINCVIEGSMPSDDIANIERIVDNGITFWRNISEVGDYSLDNSI